MAKRQTSTIASAEHKIEEFADDLGKLLGHAKTKAEGWIGQRKSIAEYLTGIRDTASDLLTRLGIGDGAAAAPKRKRGRRRKKAAGAVASLAPTAAAAGRKIRTMSAEARARISAAQKKRWARLRKSQGA
ncbi:MAG: hypothetical protein GEU82_04085 [Luteitalea sp.]|nr:hypothetical protein [Luteitalea sp.]